MQRATGKSTLSKPDFEETNFKELDALKKQNREKKPKDDDIEELVVNWQARHYSKVFLMLFYT